MINEGTPLDYLSVTISKVVVIVSNCRIIAISHETNKCSLPSSASKRQFRHLYMHVENTSVKTL